jgi:polyisoprenoid-binding protein YceI
MKRTVNYLGISAIALTVATCAGNWPELLSIDSGSISFEAGTTVPGISVKGNSTSFSGQAGVTRDAGSITLEQLHIVLPVKSLVTGMKVRDEHMRKYIFQRPDGQLPDVEFTADQTACRHGAAADEFVCQVSGQLTLRGEGRPFAMIVTLKESGPASMVRAAGDGVVKLSDYGIPVPSQLGVSTTNEVKVHVSLAARQKTAAPVTAGDAR